MKNLNVKPMIGAVLSLLFMAVMVGSGFGSTPNRSNGKIAFTSDRDGNPEIYVMNSDGSGQTRLTNDVARDDFAAWSPDGRHIAFLRQNWDASTINVMDADGSNVRELASVAVSPFDSFPTQPYAISWSPDGRRIAFQDSSDIYTIRIDGNERVNLTGGLYVNYEPSWSPDGSRIAFVRSIYEHGGYPDAYTMRADGSDVVKIVEALPYDECRSPSWSPDGGKIALGDAWDAIDGNSLAVVNPDGTGLNFVFTNGDSHTYVNSPKWAPDGTRIVFDRIHYNVASSQIWAIDRDAGNLQQLTSTSSNYHPDWQAVAPTVNVTNLEELYAAVNNPQRGCSDRDRPRNIYFVGE